MNIELETTSFGISGLVVKSVVAIDGPRVRFTADAIFLPTDWKVRSEHSKTEPSSSGLILC